MCVCVCVCVVCEIQCGFFSSQEWGQEQRVTLRVLAGSSDPVFVCLIATAMLLLLLPLPLIMHYLNLPSRDRKYNPNKQVEATGRRKGVCVLSRRVAKGEYLKIL